MDRPEKPRCLLINLLQDTPQHCKKQLRDESVPAAAIDCPHLKQLPEAVQQHVKICHIYRYTARYAEAEVAPLTMNFRMNFPPSIQRVIDQRPEFKRLLEERKKKAVKRLLILFLNELDAQLFASAERIRRLLNAALENKAEEDVQRYLDRHRVLSNAFEYVANAEPQFDDVLKRLINESLESRVAALASSGRDSNSVHRSEKNAVGGGEDDHAGISALPSARGGRIADHGATDGAGGGGGGGGAGGGAGGSGGSGGGAGRGTGKSADRGAGRGAGCGAGRGAGRVAGRVAGRGAGQRAGGSAGRGAGDDGGDRSVDRYFDNYTASERRLLMSYKKSGAYS